MARDDGPQCTLQLNENNIAFKRNKYCVYGNSITKINWIVFMDLNYMSLKLIMSDINQIQNAVYIVNWMNLLHFTYFWKSYVLYKSQEKFSQHLR